ncbi:MAG: hypothetical protein ACREID_01605 [Planctomycetota bacterium]
MRRWTQPRHAHLAGDEIRARADAITARLLYGDEPFVDIEIAIDALRESVRESWPDRVWLFDALYVARWHRLREQGWARERA